MISGSKPKGSKSRCEVIEDALSNNISTEGGAIQYNEWVWLILACRYSITSLI